MDDKKILLLLSALWWLLLPVVGFVGDFPLNDDWAYGHNVYHLSERGEVAFSSWPAMTLIAQTLWGTLFCKVFGFSFTVLRLSTLTIAWLGGLAAYGLARRLGAGLLLSAFSVLVWWFNPLSFSLSYTFMTDVHFLSVCLFSIYFYVRYAENPHIKWFLLGTLFSVLAILIRQTAIFVPLSFMIYWLVQQRFAWRSWLVALLPLVLSAATLSVYTYWRQKVYGLPPSWGSIMTPVHAILNGSLFNELKTRPGELLVFMGYFLMPLIVVLSSVVLRTVSLYKQLIALALSIGLCFCWLYIGGVWRRLPDYGAFYNFALGPKVLIDTHNGENGGFELSGWGLELFRGLGALAGGALLWSCFSVMLSWRAFAFTRRQWALVLGCFLGGLAYAAYLMVDWYFFDRYFLAFNLFIFAAILPFWQYVSWAKYRLSLIFAAISLLPLLWFAISGTHDYLAWNRARWQGLNYLTDTLKINPHLIDGGFEFNGWHQTGREKTHAHNTTGWWFVDKDDYAITFGQFRNYQPIQFFEYQRWLPPFGTDSLWVMQKPQPVRIDTIFCDAETLDSTGTLLMATDSVHFFGGGHLRSDIYVYSGKYSVRMTKDTAFAFQITSPNAKPYNEYILSAWVYGEWLGWGGLHGDTHLVGASLDSKQFFNTSFFNERSKAGWQFKQHRIIVPQNFPDTAIQHFVWYPKEGTVWVDDVQLVRIEY